MGWDIKIWHEEADDRMRLIIEASLNVPDDVISSVAGAYWVEEVQFDEEAWDDPEFNGGPPDFPGKLQG